MNVGVAAHITAAAPGGPRFDGSLTPEQRSEITNGIWLCQTCAKLVDNDLSRFTAETLREWKLNAERQALAAVGKPGSSVAATAMIIKPAHAELLPQIATDIEEIKKHSTSLEVILAFVVVAVGLITALLPLRTRGAALACSAVIWLLGIYPASHLGALAFSHLPRWPRNAVALVLWFSAVAVFGTWVWPSTHRHLLRSGERAVFEMPLKAVRDKSLGIQIACPYNDENSCVFANQFVSLFGESGWKVQAVLQRVMLSKGQDGVTIYRRGGNKNFTLEHWDAGAYFAINEPHLLAAQSAFQSIGIEPEGGTNPDLPDNLMMIYIGLEKENEGEPTDLTRSTEWVQGKKPGPFPLPKK